MHPHDHVAPTGAARPFSALALSAADRLAVAAGLIGLLWLCVAWALDWI